MKILAQRFHQPVRFSDLLNFFRQLSTLITAGLSLMKSLDILMQTTEKPAFRSLVKALRIDLESGKAFNRCLQRHPQFFDLFCCQLIHIGEQTGTLDLMLKRITLYKEKNQSLNQELKQALLYPALILTAALLTTFILLFFVVPQFAALFEHFPNKIPAPTRALIQLAFWLRKLAPLLGLLGLGAVISLFRLRNSIQFRARCQRLIFQLPYLSDLVLKITLAKFSRNLATMLSAGLPLTEALLLISQLSSFEELKRGSLETYAGVNAGKRLASSLQHSPLFPPLLIHMTQIGEESGTLDQMLEKFAEIYETEFEQALDSFKLLLEPLIIAILGVLIGGVVLAMYLPIFRLGTAI